MTTLEQLSRSGWILTIQHHADHSMHAPDHGAAVFSISAWRVTGDTIESQKIESHKATRPTLAEAVAALQEECR